MVADGHLTDAPIESIYSGVVSLRGLRTLIFIGELNGLEIWVTDVGNAYLEAATKEKIYFIAGAEFGELEGHTFVIVKALYGLRTSGLRWHERFADCLREMGFFPSKAESDTWMRLSSNSYDYLGVYVDDLTIVSNDPQAIIADLANKYRFKLKGTGPIQFHLGMDFFRDADGVLCISAKKYIDKMVSSFERLFGTTPNQKVTSPLDKGDHPEFDTSELLDDEGIQQYQSLIGALEWAISIGRFDINTEVMTLSSFRVAPRHGHLERVKRVYGYLSKMKDAAIRIRTNPPDLSELPEQFYTWDHTVYGDVKEILDPSAPIPYGALVTLVHYFDANLYHHLITGRSVTGILHFFNKTPIEWCSKKQATVETATYGSEFIAARTCVDQIVDLRSYLRYLGVPVNGYSYMIVDNKTVIDGATFPHAKLHKRHNALSFHRVREAVASDMLKSFFIDGEFNPADILSKHWGHHKNKPI
jgi:Reverse transcriptase (RNA-dependent DNA polymerase)